MRVAVEGGTVTVGLNKTEQRQLLAVQDTLRGLMRLGFQGELLRVDGSQPIVIVANPETMTDA